MFEPSKIEVRCVSASTNSENQGQSEDTRLGMSMYFEFQAANEMLDKFDPRLRTALYEPAISGQTDLTGHLPKLKFSFEKPLCWPYVGLGYNAVIHPEFDVNDGFEIEDCKVDKFQFSLKEDGVVGIKFRIYFHPDLDAVGPLCALEKHTVTLSLFAPEVAPVPEHDEPEPQAEMFSGDEAECDDQAGEIDKDAAQAGLAALADDDTTYAEAVMLVQAQKAPRADYIRRKLKITASLAEEYLQRMEDEGIVTAADHSGQRTVIEMEPA